MKEQSVKIKKSKKKISSFKKQEKLDSNAMEQMKLALAIVVQERDASYAAVTEAQAGYNYGKKLGELCPGIFQNGWMAYLKEGIPPDHPAWSAAAPEVKPMDPSQPYSSLVLPGFNEEEYMKEPSDEKSFEVAVNLGQDAVEVSMTAEGGSNANVSPTL
ncbi:hypothetical protein Acr_06g0010060 [Actinidia rufa]|uniref:Uncharacterized protein n=1 Tax=Actinidia rufa TaxID=165716 RepID=A0A7J0ES73_9ERIC|nr:hypothetical protein Acr_06g0010060 [Actinidia rufa]